VEGSRINVDVSPVRSTSSGRVVFWFFATLVVDCVRGASSDVLAHRVTTTTTTTTTWTGVDGARDSSGDDARRHAHDAAAVTPSCPHRRRGVSAGAWRTAAVTEAAAAAVLDDPRAAEMTAATTDGLRLRGASVEMRRMLLVQRQLRRC